MSTKTYYTITASVFLIIAALHLLRIAYGWEAVIGGLDIPLWWSWAAVLLAGYLSFRGFTHGGKDKVRSSAKHGGKSGKRKR